MCEVDLPRAEQEERERQWYIYWLLVWNQGPAVEPRELQQLSTFDLARCFVATREARMLGNVEWGVENAQGASREQREALIDAMVGLDTGGSCLGTEKAPSPSAGGCLDEAPLLWAAARRKRLKRLRAEDLTIECGKLLTKHAEAIERHRSTLAMARSVESQRKRELVNLRYDYGPTLIEAAQFFRGQRIGAKEALRQTAASPLTCSTGAVMLLERDRIVVRLFDGKRVEISQNQFIKNWWPKGRLPPTA